MPTTLDLDDDLLDQAKQLSGITDTATLVREALKALIARESAKCLTTLGGSDPDATTASRG